MQPQACLPPARVSSRVLGLDCFQLEVIHTPKRHLGGRVCSPTNVGAAALPATQASETCWILVLSGVLSTAVAHRLELSFHVCVTCMQKYFYRYVPKTSLSSPPWPEVVLPDPVEEARHHAGKGGGSGGRGGLLATEQGPHASRCPRRARCGCSPSQDAARQER